MAYDGSIKFDTSIDTKKFDSGLKSLKGTAAVGFSAIGAAAAAGIGAAIKMGSEFEEAMSSVGAISMATGSDLEMLTAAAQEMGETTKFSATQAANALEYLSLAGYNAEESVRALPQVLNLAAAGGMELAYASDLLTDSMAVMGLGIDNMANFSDQLAMAASKSNTSVAQLGEAVLIAGGQAKLANMSVDQMNTALGILADKGIKGSEGGTALRNTLKNLYTPTSAAAKMMESLGIKTSDASGKLLPMQTVLTNLRDSLSRLSAADKMNAMAEIFDTRTIAAASALLDDCGERWDELNGYLNDCDGAAEQMAKIMNDNLKGQLTLCASAAEGLGIAIYDGIKEPLKDSVKTGAEKISELTSSMKNGELKPAIESFGRTVSDVSTGLINLATTAIPLVIGGINTAAPIISATLPLTAGLTAGIITYKGALTAAAAAQNIYNLAVGALAHPAALGIAGVAALGGVIYTIAGKIQNAKEEYYRFGDAIEEAGEKFDTAKDKADLTDENIAQWRNLKDAISSGKLPAEELAAAESKVKEIEKWFIDNYGEYISAEEQKNGIRDKTVDKLEKQAQKMSEIAKLELESSLLDQTGGIDDKASKANSLEKEINDLEVKKQALLEAKTELQNLKNEFDTWEKENAKASDETRAQKIIDYINAVTEVTGKNYSTFSEASVAVKDYDAELKDLESKLSKNKKSFDDLKNSLGEYAGGVQRLIQLDLGETVGEANKKMDLLTQAQKELNSEAGLTNETYNKLIEKFPQLKDVKENPQLLADEIELLDEKLNKAKETAEKFHTTLEGIPNKLTVEVEVKFPKIQKNASGTLSAREGLSVVNERGTELIEGKDGSFRYVDTDRAALTYLNKGDKVYTAAQTAKMLSAKSVKLRGFAGGINNRIRSSSGFGGLRIDTSKLGKYIDLSIAAGIEESSDEVVKSFQAMLDKLDYQRDFDIISEDEYYTELEKLRDRYFAVGTKEWLDYTQKLYDYQEKLLDDEKDKYKETYKSIAEYAEDKIDEIIDKQESYRKKLSSYGSLFNKNTIMLDEGDIEFYSLSDIGKDIEALREYNSLMASLRSEILQSGISEGAADSFLEEINSLSVEEGTKILQAVKNAGESEFTEYLKAYEEKLSFSESASAAIYENEFNAAVDDVTRHMQSELIKAGFEVPEEFFDIGALAAEKFGEAFSQEISDTFEKIQLKIEEFKAKLKISFEQSPDASGGGTVIHHNETYSTSYSISSTNGSDAVSQIKNYETVKRLAGV